MPVKVFLVFASTLLLGAIKALFKEDPDFQVTGAAGNIEEALMQIDGHSPDIILADDIVSGDGITGLSALNKKCPLSKIIILKDIIRSNYLGDLADAVKAGVRGVLSYSSDISELIDSVRVVARNNVIVYASSAMGNLSGEPAQTRPARDELTGREMEVLRCVALGYGNKQIAIRHSISESTVKAHLRQVSSKLRVKNRAQAVAKAHELGLLKEPAIETGEHGRHIEARQGEFSLLKGREKSSFDTGNLVLHSLKQPVP